jgi:hypothetical protein
LALQEGGGLGHLLGATQRGVQGRVRDAVQVVDRQDVGVDDIQRARDSGAQRPDGPDEPRADSPAPMSVVSIRTSDSGGLASSSAYGGVFGVLAGRRVPRARGLGDGV